MFWTNIGPASAGPGLSAFSQAARPSRLLARLRRLNHSQWLSREPIASIATGHPLQGDWIFTCPDQAP